MFWYILFAIFSEVFYLFILPFYFIIYLRDSRFEIDFYYIASTIALSALSYIGLAFIIFLLLLDLLSRQLNKYVIFLRDRRNEHDMNQFRNMLRRKNEK